MPTIEITESAKTYLDYVIEETAPDSDDYDDLTYSQAIKRLKNRSWDAAHGGGQEELEADERPVKDEYGTTGEHFVKIVNESEQE